MRSREWPVVFELTKAARKKLLEFIEAEGGTDEWGLSVSAGPGGNYGLELVELKLAEEGTLIEGVKNAKGLSVFVEESSKMFVKGMVIDYVERLQGAGFKFENPDAPESAFAGGASRPAPELSGEIPERIQQVLDAEINPALSSHGGWVQLLDWKSDNGTVFVEMGGGCRGCGMVSVTLKGGIETRLKELIPEVQSIIDSTDHAGGANPYYSPGK